MSKRKFFSGNSIRQAVLAAASHFDISPEELAYREVDKKHGFLKLRKRVIIEVDADDPRSTPVEIPATERNPDEPARKGESLPRGEMHDAAADELEEPPGPQPKGRVPYDVEDEEPEDEELEETEAEEEPDEDEEAEAEEAPAPPRGRPGREGRTGAGRGEGAERRRAAEKGAGRDEEAAGGRGRRRGRGRGGRGDEDMVELSQGRRDERRREARGTLADACRTGLDRILDVAGLDVEYKVYEAEDRFEVELSGPHEELLVAEDGDLLRAIEHLLPRAMRGIAGESMLVRVNCGDFHEIHEERLRSLAQEAAAEVRRSGEASRLDPMSPADRRIVHVTLADEPGVSSASDGSGHYKQIVVRPI